MASIHRSESGFPVAARPPTRQRPPPPNIAGYPTDSWRPQRALAPPTATWRSGGSRGQTAQDVEISDPGGSFAFAVRGDFARLGEQYGIFLPKYLGREAHCGVKLRLSER